MWGVGGCLLLVPIACWLMAFVQNRNLIDQWVSVLLFLGMAAWLSQFLTVRVRVDSTGIYRRRLWGWDFWSWDEFESGLIRKKSSVGGYVNPLRPWWRRSLDLGYLERSQCRVEVCSIEANCGFRSDAGLHFGRDAAVVGGTRCASGSFIVASP
jgi:hypothetical protein